MTLLDNTNMIYGVSTPKSFLRGNSGVMPYSADPRRLNYSGLGAVGDTQPIDPLTEQPITAPGGTSISDAITGAIAAVNAEATYLTDQIRAAKNLPPSTPGAPGITVGLSPATQNLVIYGGIALAAFLFLRRR